MSRHGTAAFLGGGAGGGVEDDARKALSRADVELTCMGAGKGLRSRGLRHEGLYVRFGGERHRVDLASLTGGKAITVYGQNEVVRDLIDASSSLLRMPVVVLPPASRRRTWPRSMACSRSTVPCSSTPALTRSIT